MDILVVEGTDAIAGMIGALVEARGHTFRSARLGLQGFDLAVERTPDVVLLDWSLAGAMTGAEVCRRLSATDATRDTPVLVFGEPDDEAKREALALGALAYYTKPFSALAVLKEIEGIKGRSSGRIRLR